MKQGRLQAKDLSTDAILRYLADRQGTWTMRWDLAADLFPDIPEKVVLAKIRSIMAAGLSGGCSCGCRGDLEITDKGLAFIGRHRIKEYNGY